jgi:hypothetical protein
MILVKTTVTGFLTPTYTRELPSGRHLHAFTSAEDVERIAQGFACGECCAKFSTFTETCPVCRISRADFGRIEDPPEEWQQFFDEHLGGCGKTQTRTSDEFIRDVGRDTDIDQVRLSSLKPGSASRKHRKG